MNGVRLAHSLRLRGAAIVALVLSHVVGLAHAVPIIGNGDFETGDLTGWTVRLTPNGQTSVQDVVLYDIDGAGPRGISQAARFDVSQVVFQDGVPAGIDLVQTVSLRGGQEYGLSADLSVLRPVPVTNLFGGRFELVVNDLVLDVYDPGDITGLVPEFGSVAARFTPASDGAFEVGLRITRPAEAALIFQFVDNVELSPVPEPATLLLLGITAAGLGLARCRQRRRKL